MDIKNLIGETTEYDKKEMLEVKKPKSWCKSISAFANGKGGKLIFGISNDNRIVGLINPIQDAEIISEQIKVNLDPNPDYSFSFEQIDDKVLIILEVYAGEETPYYYIGNKERTAFVRRGNQSVNADRIALNKLVMKGRKTSYDSLVSNENFDDLSFTQLKAAFYQATGTSMTDEDFESFGIINHEGSLTNAGALLADDSPVRHSRLFCTRWNGLTMASGLVDAIDDAEYSDGLVQLLKNGVRFIKRNTKNKWMKLPQGRIDMPDYPERAVFEGLCNALIHRDYMDVGSEVHMDLYDDRLEIYSPGGMVDGSLVQNIDVLHVSSKRRNPIVADIFSRLKYVDRRGSGFKKIIEDYKRQPTYTDDKHPVFYSEQESFYLILKNLNYDTNVVKDVVKDVVLENEIEKKILELIKNNPMLSSREIAQELTVSERTIQRKIKNLKDKNIIVREGGRKDGQWKIVK